MVRSKLLLVCLPNNQLFCEKREASQPLISIPQRTFDMAIPSSISGLHPFTVTLCFTTGYSHTTHQGASETSFMSTSFLTGSRVLDYLDVRLQPLSYGMSNWNTEFKHNVIMCQMAFSFKPLVLLVVMPSTYCWNGPFAFFCLVLH